MSPDDLASFISAPDLASDHATRERLLKSAQSLQPKLWDLVSAVIDESPSVQIACAGDRARAEMALTSYLALVLENLASLDSVKSEIQGLGHLFPDEAQTRVAIVANMARLSSYTWTRRLSMDWTRVLAMTMAWTPSATQRQAA